MEKTMPDPNVIILYVDNPLRSADFYARLLKKPPIQTSPNFAMFALDSGVMLGLWSKHVVEPPATAAGGGGEIAFSVSSRDVVGDLFTEWTQRGLVIEQEPTDMDFGHTFVALDPDGHRLRVFAPTTP
jgi:catechol 2,3-dioxygenase-like lactoylglutathione lyase family enzyme